ncbi:MAG: GntR family transcriptional regulator [Deltaproteobacteria bacterium]|nr:MAG: GntR family transcriptional regulator [Deltaproteobacteria bacterium]TMB28517.1 MAG: GntR family transcriptional regulator [Deltaproteobacteria bacterium]
MASPRALLRVDIYQKLREEILACELPPGADLREQSLAARFSVSKSPVRDALLRLERERLVTISPRQGYRVAPVSVADARDLFRLRSVLEAASVMEGARAAPDEDLQALDRFRSFREKSQRGGFLAYNREFHCALARLSGNERMTTAACELIDQMHRLIRVSVDNVERREPNRLVLEHVRIIEALQRRDGRRAAALLRRHIDAAERRVARALERAAVVA